MAAFQICVVRLVQFGLEGSGAELILAVEGPEQGLQALEQSLAIALDLRHRETRRGI